MINGLVDKPLVFTMEDIKRMPRVNKVYFLECAANSGMEWRGAQLNGCQFTHGMIHNVMYTGVPLRVLLDEAGLKPNAKWLMLEGADAAGMNRSLPIEKALNDVTHCLCDERRGAAAGAGLSLAGRDPGLGRQSLGEMAAPDRGRRPAVADPRGDLEIYRPAGRRPLAQTYLRHGCKIGGDESVAAGAAQVQGTQRPHRRRMVRPRQRSSGSM